MLRTTAFKTNLTLPSNWPSIPDCRIKAQKDTDDLPDVQARVERRRVVLLGEPWQRALQQCEPDGQQDAHREQHPGHPAAKLVRLFAPPYVQDGLLERGPVSVHVVGHVQQEHRDARLLGQHAQPAEHDAQPDGVAVRLVVTVARRGRENESSIRVRFTVNWVQSKCSPKWIHLSVFIGLKTGG